MTAASFHFLNLDKFRASLRGAAAATPTEMRAAMGAATLVVEGEARSLAPRDEARLQGSITSRITGSGLSLRGEVGPSVGYGLYVELGRRPNKPPPPPQALAGWARRHGIAPTRGNLFVLARSIGRKGIKPHPFIAPALANTKGRVEAIFARIGARVFSRVQS